MKNKNTNYRRFFLKLAGAALVALSIVSASFAQTNSSNAAVASNNLKQIQLYGISAPNPNLPGVFGLAGYQIQMRADIEGAGGGFLTLSDPIFTEINSHIQIQSYRRMRGDLYVFSGTVSRSQSAELIGKTVVIRVQILPDNNCDVSLTVEDSCLALLLPAIQAAR